MKLFITSIFLICSTLVLGQNKRGQNNSFKENNSPRSMLVVDTMRYPLDNITMAKIDPNWIEKIELFKDEHEKYIYSDKNGIILIYPKKRFIDHALMILNSKTDTLIYKTVDSYPEFKYAKVDTTIEAIEKFFKQNYQMPQILTDNGYSGKIYVRCIVEKNGHLSSIEIKQGIDKSLDESVREFVKKMPIWIPAKIKNENVRYHYIFPVDIKWLYGEIK